MSAPLVICDYCMHAAELVDGKTIRADLAGRPFYKCTPCQAWIAVDVNTGLPRGRLANSFLRKAKHETYSAIDKLAERIMALHSITDKHHARRKSMGMLAGKMDIQRHEFDVALFTEEECIAATLIATKAIEGMK